MYADQSEIRASRMRHGEFEGRLGPMDVLGLRIHVEIHLDHAVKTRRAIFAWIVAHI
jgi:hypothetical protein